MAGEDTLEFLSELDVVTKGANKAFGDLDRTLKNLHGVVQNLAGKAIEPLLQGLKKVAAFAVKAGVAGVEKVPAIVQGAGEAQRTSRLFAVLSGGKTAGAANEQWIERFARTSDVSEKHAAQAFLALKNVGMDDVSARLALKASADLAAVSPNKDETMDAAIRAFAELPGKKKIKASALAPLSLGVEKGNVTRDDLIDLIMKKTNETMLGQRSADNADLLLTKMQRLSDLPDRFMRRLGNTEAVKTLSDALDHMVAILDPDSPTGRRISEFLEKTITKVADLIDSIDIEETIGSVIEIFETLEAVAGPVLDAIAFGLEGIGFVIASIRGKGDEFVQRGVEAQRRKAERERVKGILNSPEHKEDMELLGDEGVSGFGANQKRWFDAGEKATTALGQGAKRGLKIQSPSQVFADLGEMSAAGFVQGIDNEVGRVDEAVEQMFPTPATARGGQAGGRPAIHLELHIHVGAGASEGDHATARALAEQVAEVLPSALEDALEKVGIGMGSS